MIKRVATVSTVAMPRTVEKDAMLNMLQENQGMIQSYH